MRILSSLTGKFYVVRGHTGSRSEPKISDELFESVDAIWQYLIILIKEQLGLIQ